MNYDPTNRGIATAPAAFSGIIDINSNQFFIWLWNAVSKKGTHFYTVSISRENTPPKFVPNNNENKGALFIKEKKSEKSPDFSGTLNVEGKEMSLAAWKRGFTDISLLVSEKLEYVPQVSKPMREKDPDPFGDDEVPF